MGKGKLQKFAEMEANPLVVQCPFWKLQSESDVTRANGEGSGAEFMLRGKWHSDFFHNDNPIILELGCGRGEYTVGLAKRNPDKNYIGVDIKGSRMWHGAKEAMESNMKNVGFLRTNIECIHELFAPGEVDEIWLTFSDPQMKKATKRLTSTYFMERYRKFVKDNGIIHLKTDSNFMFTYTRLMVEHNSLPVIECVEDLYGEPLVEVDESLRQIRTYYEQMWLDRGLSIKYLEFNLPHSAVLTEPEVDIPVDDYRSYNHEVRSTRTVGR